MKNLHRAMLFAGFATFALLYCVQPLMPLYAQQFHLSPAQSSGVLSVTLGALAVSLVASAAWSDRIGRKNVMLASMLASSLLTLACACAQDYAQLLVLRGLLGISLGGVPAVAMAYLAEEVDGPQLGMAMGIYIGGSAFGGMLGRVIAALLSEVFDWRYALALMGLAGLYASWEFARSLPASRHFRPTQAGWPALRAGLLGHLRDPGLRWLYLLAFLLMGCFVSLYNYIGYRLLDAPFSLRTSTVGLLSVLYAIGMGSSVWAGRLADRMGRRQVLWMMLAIMLTGLVLTLAQNLAVVVLGMALFTFGFFAAHSVASSWVGRRARAPQALASALYLFFYYLGSGLVGYGSGLVWAMGGWIAVVSVLSLALGAALLIALHLRGLAPNPQSLHNVRL